MKPFQVLIAGAFALLPTSVLSNGADVIREYLGSALPSLPQCSEERIAIEHTMEALLYNSFPTSGKFVIVNIPGASLTAYEDGEPVLEMKVIVGKPQHPTPVQSTSITEVRLNPTWTVPQSIIRDEGWKARLNEEPDFFTRNNFEFRSGAGEILTLSEAQENPSDVALFVQSPGRYNALGEYRFNIQSSQAIYLHDTSDREAFYEEGPIALSHGCVRVQRPQEFAQWLLDLPEDDVREMQRDGSTLDLELPYPVPIIMEYFTAWPNAAGEIVVYDDIYQRQHSSCYSDW